MLKCWYFKTNLPIIMVIVYGLGATDNTYIFKQFNSYDETIIRYFNKGTLRFLGCVMYYIRIITTMDCREIFKIKII